jgi:hypothetical protein
MKNVLLAITMSLIGAGVSMAQVPAIDVSAGGVSSTITLTSLGTGTVTVNGQSYVGDEYTGAANVGGLQFDFNGVDPNNSAQLGVVYNTDPFLFYSYSVTNTLTTAINVNANIPVSAVTLGPGTYTETSSLGVSLTDGNPSATSVSVSPLASPGVIQQNLVNGSDAGDNLGTSTFAVTGFGNSNTVHYTAGPTWYTATSPITSIGVNTSFQLDAGASLGLTGFFDLEPLSSTPEPSGLGLALMAVGVFAFLMFRTRRAR